MQNLNKILKALKSQLPASPSSPGYSHPSFELNATKEEHDDNWKQEIEFGIKEVTGYYNKCFQWDEGKEDVQNPDYRWCNWGIRANEDRLYFRRQVTKKEKADISDLK